MGELSRFNRWLTKNVCKHVDLLITWTEIARERLLAMGINRPILANTDPAFRFLTEESPAFSKNGTRRVVGIAPIEFLQWPVQFKLWGALQRLGSLAGVREVTLFGQSIDALVFQECSLDDLDCDDAEIRPIEASLGDVFVSLARHRMHQAG